ncbi:hypothetical protein EXE63_11065 [Mycolicibacterium frederiksbergense]|uniref:Uncharacterized protein n=1 Tax=Mycolicibacterium frederiksbergense TaxID=117567 RepID=A0A6H0S4J7_9MYCO|nr:hypothetical protein EXE63_11065 [Mycolicibacterium frederiksbergense]
MFLRIGDSTCLCGRVQCPRRTAWVCSLPHRPDLALTDRECQRHF